MSETKPEMTVHNVRKKEIDLKEYYDVIKRRLWIVALITVLTTAAGALLTGKNDSLPLYESSTRVLIASTEGDIKTLLVMVTDPLLMEKVSGKLDLNQSPEGLASQIRVEKINDSQVIKITAADPDAKTAAEIANTTASLFKSEMAEMLNFNNITLLAPAEESFAPIPAQGTSVKIFIVVGLVLGMGVVFLLDSLDDTVKKETEIEELLGVPVMGAVSNMHKQKWSFKKNKKNKLPIRGEAYDAE